MTEEQAKSFLREVTIAFPGISYWVNSNSPDAAGTFASWRKTLSKVKIEEAISVLNRWVAGTLEVPSGYQVGTFPHHVVAIVDNDRSQASRLKNRERILENGKRESIFSKDPVLGPYMAEVANIVSKRDKGLLTEEEIEDAIREAKQEANRKLDENYARRTA